MQLEAEHQFPRARLRAHGRARLRTATRLATAAAALAALATPLAALPRPCNVAAIAGGATTVTARVLDSGFDVALDVEGYAKDDKPSVEHGEVILSGTLDTGKKSIGTTTLALIAERNEPRMTSEERCEARAHEGGGSATSSVEYFKVRDITCYERLASLTMSGPSGSSSGSFASFSAFPLVGDHVVEIRLSSITLDGSKQTVWARDRFVKLVKTFAAKPSAPPDLAADNGLPALPLPPELEDARKQAAGQGKTAATWLGEQCAAQPDDWPLQFVCGEYGDRAALARACELLGAKPEPTPKERGARFLAERVLGARLVAEGLAPDAAPHLEHALELLTVLKLGREVRAPLVYELAGCRAQGGQADAALDLLKEAIKLDASLRDAAREDEAFASLKDNKAFKSLVKS